MADIDWKQFIEDEDRLLDNSDRRFRRHNNSLESMSEEFVYQLSVANYEQDSDATNLQDDDFISSLKNTKLRTAMMKLTKKQRQAVELCFGQELKHWEVAQIMGCDRSAVSHLLERAMEKIILQMEK